MSSSPERMRLTLSIYGKVQGVFFRVSTKEHAEKLGITGIVRNEPDGSVFIEAEGAPRKLEEFVKWCDEGPEGAIVESLIKREEEGQKGYTSFQIE